MLACYSDFVALRSVLSSRRLPYTVKLYVCSPYGVLSSHIVRQIHISVRCSSDAFASLRSAFSSLVLGSSDISVRRSGSSDSFRISAVDDSLLRGSSIISSL